MRNLLRFLKIPLENFRSPVVNGKFATRWLSLLLTLTAFNVDAQTYFSQDFSSSTTVSDYVSATPNSGQFTQIGANTNTSVAITGNALAFSRTSAGLATFTRSVALNSPNPSGIRYSFDVSVTSGTTITSACRFRVGTSFSNTVVQETNANTFSQILIDFEPGNQFRIRNAGGTTSALFSGTQNVRWYMNSSASTMYYTDGGGVNASLNSVAQNTMDVWVGTTLVFDNITITTAGIPISNLKFQFEQGAAASSISLDNIIIRDGFASITCPPNINVGTDPGNCYATLTSAQPVLSNYCGAAGSIFYNNSLNSNSTLTGAIASPGVTTVVWDVTDSCGNYNTCSMSVTVTDNENPSMAGPANLTRSLASNSCTYTAAGAEFDRAATDNCGLDSLQYELTGATTGFVRSYASAALGYSGLSLNGVVFNRGVTNVQWRAKDIHGNVSYCNFTVTVNDVTNPVVSNCPSNIIQPRSCAGSVSWTAPTATDACGIASTTSNYSPGATFPVGTTTVTYTFTDNAGLISTCSFDVVITALTASTSPSLVNLTCNTLTTSSTASSANAVGSVSYSWSNGDLTATATNLSAGTHTVTVTDAANGCTATANVTVNNPTRPGSNWYVNSTTGNDANIGSIGCPKATISAAVAAATAGETIIVDAGTYSESVTVNKQLTITGANAGTSGCGSRGAESEVVSAGTAFTITANGVVIDGFKMTAVTGVSSTGFSATVTNNKINAAAAGINAAGISGGYSITNNCITLSAQTAGPNPTIGVGLFGVSGSSAAVVSNNNVAGGYYGYLLYAVNSATVSSVSGGTVTGCAQGVAAFNGNPPTYPYAASNVSVSNVSISGPVGGNPQAGVYAFTGGSNSAATVTMNISGVSVSGTGKLTPDAAAMNFSDFSSGVSSNMQIITVSNSTLSNNSNRGVNARGKAQVSVSTSSLTGNGFDPYGTGGNSGYGVIALNGAVVNLDNSFVTNPATVTAPYKVVSLAIGNAPGGTINAHNNRFDNNGNANGYYTSNFDGVVNASCNWWGWASECKITPLFLGSIATVYSPWITSDSDLGGNAADGYQPGGSCANNVLAASASKTDVLCNGGNTGTASASATGGQTPYSYTWSDAQTTQTATGLIAGTYTVTVTDANGCSIVAASVTVGEPTVLTAGITSQTNVSCAGGANGSVTVAAANGTPGYQYKLDNGVYGASGTFSGLSAGSYTVTAKDANGCTTPVAVTITEIDVDGPVLSGVPANTTVNCQSVPSPATVTAADQNPSSPTVTMTEVSTQGVNPALASYYNYTITRTWSATDACGQGTSATQVITVEDVTKPSIAACAADQDVNLNGTCQLTVPSLTGGVSASDNCASANLTITQSPLAGAILASSHNATHIVTITVTDPSGNAETCQVTLTGKDITAPTVSAAAGVSVSTDANQCSASVAIAPATFSDNCSGSSLTYTLSGATTQASTAGQVGTATFNKGTTTITYTAADLAGLTSTATQTVTVTDNENPSVSCTSAKTANTDNNACTYTHSGTAWDATGTDNCGTISFAYVLSGASTGTGSSLAGAVFNKGTTLVTWTATDGNFNTASCSFNVVVSDVQAPSVTCASNKNVTANSGGCTYTHTSASWDASFGDNCAGSSVSYSLSSPSAASGLTTLNGAVFSLGTTTVTATVTDASSNTAVCTFTVTVADGEAPSISCPANVTVTQQDSRDPWATGYATASDCSGPVTISYTDNRAGLTGCNATGTIVRTWSAKDGSNNTATCVQTITVTDVTAPVVTCPANITVSNDPGNCSAVVNYTATANDFGFFQGFEDAAWMSGRYTDQPSVDWNDYSSAITRVASGTDGITSKTGSAHAVINSSSLPASPYDYTGAFSRVGGYSSAFGAGFTTSVDVYIDMNDPAILANTYGWDVDQAISNQSAGFLRDFIFHVSGQPGSVLITGDNGTNFTRYNPSYIATLNHATITTSGWYTMEWNFRNNGGTLACDFIVRNAAGTAIWTYTRTSADNIATTVGGNRYMWFNFLEVAKLAIDNTTHTRHPVVAYTTASGSTFPKGTTSVTASTTDACGQPHSCSFTVTVNDTEAPSISCTSDKAVNTDATLCTYTHSGTAWNATGADNCTAVSFAYVLSGATTGTGTSLDGVAFNKGATLVTWTATDGSNNTNVCSFTVTVSDNEDPSIIGMPSSFTATRTCAGSVSWTAPTAADNCPGVTLTSTANPGDNFLVGTTTVTYTATDAAGNSVSASFDITIVAFSISGTSVTNVSCNGASNGTATVTTANTQGAVTYLWSDGQTTATATGLAPGAYTVTVTNGSCTATQTTAVITEPIQVTISATATNVSCNGAADGTITASASAGASITVNGNPYVANATYGPGSYTIVASAPNGNNNGACTATTTVTITEPIEVTIAATSTNVSCFGAANGTITATASAGADITVNGNPYNALATYGPGTYTIVATASNGNNNGSCTATTTVTITEPIQVTISATSTNVSCNGAADGTITATSSLGATITVNGNPYNALATYGPGTYTIVASAANGNNNGVCTATTTVTITEPIQVTISASSTNVSCNGAADGTITASASAGASITVNGNPYNALATYGPGSYTIVASASNGNNNGACTATTTVTITEPITVTVSASSTNVSCNGAADGTITASASAGASITVNGNPYNALATYGPGTYTIVASAPNGNNNGACTATTSVTITQPIQVTISASSTNVSCNGAADGTITASASAGASITVNGNPYNALATYGPGTYTIVASAPNGNANGSCTATTTVSITQPITVTVSASSTNVSCNGAADGTITASASAGASITVNGNPYNALATYGPGSYTIVASAPNGNNNGVCTATTSVTITQPIQVTISASSTNVTCNGAANGTITASASAGASITVNGNPYNAMAAYGPGTYTIVASAPNGNANGFCTATTSVTITQPNALVASATQTGPVITCNGATTQVTVSAVGGTTPYTGTGVFTVGAGTHNYTVTDANGCSSATSIVVSQPILLPTPVVNGIFNRCQVGAGTATFTVAAVSDGVNTTSYTWSVPAGFTITSGQGTTTLNVSYTAAAIDATISGQVSCTAFTVCTSKTGTATVSYSTTGPVSPNSISGPTRLCPGDVATYSIAAVYRASSYIWTAPTGVTITSGQGTNVINVSVDNTYTGGTFGVSASNACATSPARTRVTALNILNAPGTISGQSTGLCASSNQVYSIVTIPGALSYTWTVPAGATIVGPSNGTSITVNFTAFTSGSITVAAINNCGTGPARSLTVTGTPGRPGDISGAISTCAGQAEGYSVATVIGASSYNWTVTAGGAVTAGQGTKTPTITWSPSASASQTVIVTASNSCGVSSNRTLAVTVNQCVREAGIAEGVTMTAYPNPAKALVNIEFTGKAEQQFNIKLTDMAGRVMLAQGGVSAEGLNKLKLDLATVPSGIYLVVLETSTAREVLRLMVE